MAVGVVLRDGEGHLPRWGPGGNAPPTGPGHILITNEVHARHGLAPYQRHYNTHRPHRSQNQLSPDAHQQPTTLRDLDARRLLRTRVLGGVINEYRYAA